MRNSILRKYGKQKDYMFLATGIEGRGEEGRHKPT
jgi:hypothetical protein